MIKNQIINGWYLYFEDFLEESKSIELLEYYMNNLPWKSGEITLFGKTCPIPRKQVYFSDDNLSYGYSGKELVIDEWDPLVLAIKDEIEVFVGEQFNACLANLYRDGQDSNGLHADNEKELGINPIIASVSFGATRRFDLKHTRTQEKLSFDLKSGSLFVMGGEMQHHWKHQIPKQRNVQEPRVNLTFRKIISI